MTARKAITDRMKWEALLYWNDVVCPECDVFLRSTDDIEWDHRHALVHGGAKANHENANLSSENRPTHADRPAGPRC